MIDNIEMNDFQKTCLDEAQMIIEIAFMGGTDDWKLEILYGGCDEYDMAAFAHALIQYARSGHINDDYKKAKVLVSRIAAAIAIEDALESSRGNNGD